MTTAGIDRTTLLEVQSSIETGKYYSLASLLID